MKKVIDKRVYNTDTAEEIGSWDNGLPANDMNYLSETLYRKRRGAYFIHADGGANTKCAKPNGAGGWMGSECIIPMDYNAAREWAEEKLDADTYEIYFDVSDDDTKTNVTFVLKSGTVDNLRRTASERGMYISDLLEQIITSELNK